MTCFWCGLPISEPIEIAAGIHEHCSRDLDLALLEKEDLDEQGGER